MADRFNDMIQKDLERSWETTSDSDSTKTTVECHHTERYAYATALFFYRSESDYRYITRSIKYNGNIKAGKKFGEKLGEKLATSPLFSDIDAIVPVPLHWQRQWRRGYNQAEVIASGISVVLGKPVVTDLLRRNKKTKTQTRLTIQEKEQNVKEAFIINRKSLKLFTEQLAPVLHHILLVDDVFTTGSTALACFTALRQVFPPPVRISIATLGFVGEV